MLTNIPTARLRFNCKEAWNIERQSGILIQFFIRGIVGLALIFFVNYYLETKGISAEVGLNPVTFTTSGVLGAPGVALLYAVTFFQGM